jgi:hypothetical protein
MEIISAKFESIHLENYAQQYGVHNSPCCDIKVTGPEYGLGMPEV